KTSVLEEGRIIHCQLEFAHKQFANFVSVYGIPHHGGEKMHFSHEDFEESNVLQSMSTIQNHVKNLIQQSNAKKQLIFVFGDLQDTPDSSKNFHYGKCWIP
ncbi:MAG: hypothetical protein ACK53Y_21205, partial [bacterium]